MTDHRETCFVAMPVSTSPETAALYSDPEHFLHVLEGLFIPAIEQAGYEVLKPTMTGSDLIQAEIIKRLEQADLVLVDISGHNPNVFFELGIRTALDRPVALVRDKETTKLPFDTSVLNTHTYDGSMRSWVVDNERAALADHLTASASRAAGHNGLWNHFGLTKRAEDATSAEDPLNAKLDLLTAEVRDLRDASSSRAMVASTVVQDVSSSRRQLYLHLPVNASQAARELIGRLWDIAVETNASFAVTSVGQHTIYLDFGNLRLTSDQAERMRQLASEAGWGLRMRGGVVLE